MTVEMEDIRAWVDGELNEQRASEIGSAVLASKSLQDTAAQLRASQLPYREAYEQVPVPDVPESLRLSIQQLNDPVMQHSEGQSATARNHGVQNLPKTSANNSFFKMAGIAASVMMAGLIGYLAGVNTNEQVADPSAPNTVANAISEPDSPAFVETSPQSENFAQTVAAYQKFYVRETLKGTAPPNPLKVTERLADQTDMQVLIPQLEGYEFMRAQRLSVDGELLLQLVYLGAEGAPLALCYLATPDSSAETDTILEKHHGLNTAEWRHNGHRFVIVSDAPEQKLEELSQSTRQQWSI